MAETFNAVINGQEVLFTILKVFSDDLYNRDIIVYTDYSKDEKDCYNLYISIYDALQPETSLEKLETMTDWETAEKFLDKNLEEIYGMLNNPEKLAAEKNISEPEENILDIEGRTFAVLAGFLDETSKKEYFLAYEKSAGPVQIDLVQVLKKDENNTPVHFQFVETSQVSTYVQNKAALLLEQLKKTE